MTLIEDLRSAFDAGALGRQTFEQWLASYRDRTPMDDLDLPVRLHNALWRAGVRTVSEVRPYFDEDGPFTQVHVLELRGIGQGSWQAGLDALARWDAEHDGQVG